MEKLHDWMLWSGFGNSCGYREVNEGRFENSVNQQINDQPQEDKLVSEGEGFGHFFDCEFLTWREHGLCLVCRILISILYMVKILISYLQVFNRIPQYIVSQVLVSVGFPGLLLLFPCHSFAY